MEKFSKVVTVDAKQINTASDAYAVAEELGAVSIDERHYFYEGQDGKREDETSFSLSGPPNKRFEASFMYGQWVVKYEDGRIRVFSDKEFKKEFPEQAL